jgi:hypothetical protein
VPLPICGVPKRILSTLWTDKIMNIGVLPREIEILAQLCESPSRCVISPVSKWTSRKGSQWEFGQPFQAVVIGCFSEVSNELDGTDLAIYSNLE